MPFTIHQPHEGYFSLEAVYRKYYVVETACRIQITTKKSWIKVHFGLRYIMDVITLDATLIKGSHGRVGTANAFYLVIITSKNLQKSIGTTDVYNVIWNTLT